MSQYKSCYGFGLLPPNQFVDRQQWSLMDLKPGGNTQVFVGLNGCQGAHFLTRDGEAGGTDPVRPSTAMMEGRAFCGVKPQFYATRCSIHCLKQRFHPL